MEGSDIVITINARRDVGSAVLEVTPTLTKSDDGLSLGPATESITHTVTGPNENSESASYRLTKTGQINLGEGDGSDLLGGEAPDSDFSGSRTDSWDVWAGSIISLQAASDTTTVAVFEADTDSDGNLQKGERVEFRGTSPGTTTAVDTSNLEADGQYLIELGQDETDLVFIDLQPLDLEATVEEEFTTEQTVEVDVTLPCFATS